VIAAGAGGAGPGGAGGLDGSEDAQPAATARAGEDIEIEHAVHQGGPGPRARGAGGAGAGLALGRMEVRGRAAVADDGRAPAGMGGGEEKGYGSGEPSSSHLADHVPKEVPGRHDRERKSSLKDGRDHEMLAIDSQQECGLALIGSWRRLIRPFWTRNGTIGGSGVDSQGISEIL